MRRLLLPFVLGGAVLLSPIASRSSAPEPTLREGLVLPLPGQLNRELMVNDNNPEVVSDSGILLSTFAAQGKAHPGAHLDVPLSGSFELFSHHVFAGKGQAPNSTLWLAVVVGNRSSQPVTVSIPSAATHLSQPDAPFLPLPPRMVHDGTSVYSGPGGRAAGDLLARAPRSESLPERIELAPGQIDVLTSLPIPVAGLDPLLNGRNLQARFNSSGPISLATLALISEQRPSEQQWLDLLQNGDLSSKEHSQPQGGTRANDLFPGQRRAAGNALERRADLSRPDPSGGEQPTHLMAHRQPAARHLGHWAGAIGSTHRLLPRHSLGSPRQLRRRL